MQLLNRSLLPLFTAFAKGKKKCISVLQFLVTYWLIYVDTSGGGIDTQTIDTTDTKSPFDYRQ